MLALGCDVLGHLVGLDHFVRDFIEASLQLAKLLNEKQFKALQIFFFLSHTEGQLFVLLVKQFFFKCHLAHELFSQCDELRINLKVDQNACNFLFKLCFELLLLRLQVISLLEY